MATPKGRTPEGWLKALERDRLRQDDRKSPHRNRRALDPIVHYAAEVGTNLAFAYVLLDDGSWPLRPLAKRLFRDLDNFSRFMTVHTRRRGVRLDGGALLLRGDGTAEERFDFHDDFLVLA